MVGGIWSNVLRSEQRQREEPSSKKADCDKMRQLHIDQRVD